MTDLKPRGRGCGRQGVRVECIPTGNPSAGNFPCGLRLRQLLLNY